MRWNKKAAPVFRQTTVVVTNDEIPLSIRLGYFFIAGDEVSPSAK
jgi:hypothetical protein